ncbi:MAG: type I-B CRISPR-associated protein Cas5b [Cyanobacteriota bacterium]
MEILTFDIQGKFAHFRKFYTNSSALSYFIPPRTTIIGIIAAILGRERDEYYEEFSSDLCKIGVKVNNKIKKATQRLNYLKIENKSDLNGSKGRTQVPFEIVMPENIKKSYVSYKIFFWHNDAKLLQELYNRIKTKRYHYPITLGTANFTAFINNERLITSNELTETENLDSFIEVNSALNLDKISDFNFSDGHKNILITEKIPLAFNKDRELINHAEIIFSINNQPINVRLKIPHYSLKIGDETINMVFME